jgi:hypothetical protein
MPPPWAVTLHVSFLFFAGGGEGPINPIDLTIWQHAIVLIGWHHFFQSFERPLTTQPKTEKIWLSLHDPKSHMALPLTHWEKVYIYIASTTIQCGKN